MAALPPALVACAPASFRQVTSPRDGRALGGKVAVVYSKHYQINMAGFERMHAFDIRKYAKIYLQLVTDGLLRPEDVFVPEAVTPEQVLLVHTPAFVEGLRRSGTVAKWLEAPVVGLAPAALVDAGILNAFRYSAGGTVQAGRLARQPAGPLARCGLAINIGGGYNHARADRGGGFNIYADVPIAVRVLQKEGLVKKAAVIDLDVHAGDGEGECLGDDNDVFTFSMYEEDIYPHARPKVSLAVPLPAGTGDAEYLATLRQHLPRVLELARPEIVFYIAGCDVLEGDPLANLKLSPEGVVARDAEVIDACVRSGIPVAMCTGGGYSKRAWQAQYLSIRRTLLKYGLAGKEACPPRQATWAEKCYVR